MRQVEAQTPDANKASMTLVGLRSRGDGEGPAGGAAEGWLPQEGEEVSVLKMGGAAGQVSLIFQKINMMMLPRAGEEVPVLKMGGAAGQVSFFFHNLLTSLLSKR